MSSKIFFFRGFSEKAWSNIGLPVPCFSFLGLHVCRTPDADVSGNWTLCQIVLISPSSFNIFLLTLFLAKFCMLRWNSGDRAMSVLYFGVRYGDSVREDEGIKAERFNIRERLL